MKDQSSAFWRACSDYGMVLVLLLLCLFFSGMTYTEQQATGATAAKQAAGDLAARFGSAARVLIVSSDQADDVIFADTLRAELTTAGATIVGFAQGTPRDARLALERLSTSGAKVDAVACSRAAASWLVFANLPADFPSLGEVAVVSPRSYSWPNFLKADNLLNIANQIAVIAVVAVGMTLVIITGGIDLSVGSLIALAAVTATWLIRNAGGALEATPLAMTLCCLAGIAVAGLAGALSGLLITAFSIPPFIVTLGMMLIASGLAYLVTQGQSIYQIPDSFVWLGRGDDLFHIPNAVLVMLLLYAAAHVLMSRTVPGRYLYAVGGNREAARLSGVPVRQVLLFAYVVSGLTAGLGGIILASQLKSGSPTYGQMYELYVIAAVVVGGTSLSGGEGKVFGTLIGAFTIAVIQNGMNLMNVESYTQKVVLGVVILSAVLFDTLRRRAWGGRTGSRGAS